ncbi:MAG: pilus assembly protein [Mesorhizobium sp.]
MTTNTGSETRGRGVKRCFLLRRFVRNSDGATAVEFGLLAIPFLLTLFAILETGVSMAVQQLLVNATDNVARQVQTGDLKTTSQADLRQRICARIQTLVASGCPGLRVDLRTYTTFQAAANQTIFVLPGETVALEMNSGAGVALRAQVGGGGAMQTLRAFYFWPLMTDLLSESMGDGNGRMLSVRVADLAERSLLRHAMKIFTQTRSSILRRFGRDRGGVAAVEFAILMPVLLCIYFGSVEVMQAVDVNRKMNRASAQIADLISQNMNVDRSSIDAIMQIGQASMAPYNRSTPDIRITAVKMSNDATPTATVLWKRNRIGGAFSAAGSSSEAVSVPATFKEKGQVVIKVETSLAYNLMLTWNGSTASNYGVAGFFNGIPMKKTYYFRPRVGGTVNCSDC